MGQLAEACPGRVLANSRRFFNLTRMTAPTIDLHLHTTASDGLCTPEELLRRAADVGLRTISVTDHDTAAAVGTVQALAPGVGIEVIPGIEITAVNRGKDVHVLAYNLPAETPELDAVMQQQRRLRVERAREIAARLERLGAPIDVDEMLRAASSNSGKAIARPQIAQYLIRAGHVGSVADAFDRFLGEQSPAYVPHQGVSPAEIVGLVERSGGLASLAHPGYTRQDEIIPSLVDAGLRAIEAFHSSHDEAATSLYLSIAQRFDLIVTGGSDYHGEGTRRSEFFGKVGLPEHLLPRLRQALATRSAQAS
jgi:3',5'-nucleoside bisphosphate phosphatase